jgi:hypothetical protein
MDQEHERYEEVIKVLRRSQPQMGNTELFSEKVLRRIRAERTGISVKDILYEFIFGWVYVGWIRRSMITTAVCLTLFFGYQQAVLMKKVDALSLRTVVEMKGAKAVTFTNLEARFKIYSLFGRKALEQKLEISGKKEVDEFIKSINDLKVQYKDVFLMIETDPQIKKYVDDHLKTEGTVKPKI